MVDLFSSQYISMKGTLGVFINLCITKCDAILIGHNGTLYWTIFKGKKYNEVKFGYFPSLLCSSKMAQMLTQNKLGSTFVPI